MSLVHQQDPDIPFHWTEGGPFIDDPEYARIGPGGAASSPMRWKTGAAAPLPGT